MDQCQMESESDVNPLALPSSGRSRRQLLKQQLAGRFFAPFIDSIAISVNRFGDISPLW